MEHASWYPQVPQHQGAPSWTDFPEYYQAALKSIDEANAVIHRFTEKLRQDATWYNLNYVGKVSNSLLKCRTGLLRLDLHGWELVLVNAERSEFFSTESHAVARPSLSCKICLEMKDLKDVVQLFCGHAFCRACMHEYLLELITQNKVGEHDLVCLEGCGNPLDEEVLKDVLSEAEQERLSLLRLPKAIDDCTLMRCPSATCDYQAYSHRDLKLFECVQCKLTYCLRCCKPYGVNYHPCVPVLKEDHTAVFLRLGYKACPKCGEGLQKEAGCNFVKCPSAHCRGLTFFCWLCTEVLTKEDHYAHFQSGPYGGTCVTASGISAATPPVPNESSLPAIARQGACFMYSCTCYFSFSSTTYLKCGHSLCRSCYKVYISDLIQLEDYNEANLLCPTCDSPIALEKFFKVFGGQRDYGNFKDSILRSTVKTSWF
jgi:hypothetical protein